jgi:hypothetical protein
LQGLVSCGLSHCVLWHAHFGVFLWPKWLKNGLFGCLNKFNAQSTYSMMLFMVKLSYAYHWMYLLALVCVIVCHSTLICVLVFCMLQQVYSSCSKLPLIVRLSYEYHWMYSLPLVCDIVCHGTLKVDVLHASTGLLFQYHAQRCCSWLGWAMHWYLI